MVKVFPNSKLRLKSRHQLQFGIEVIIWITNYYLPYTKFIPDKTLCKLSLGPGENRNAGSQWKKMVENPDEHSFAWHEVNFD